MFETLNAMPPDAILTLIGEHENDPRTSKIDLGVGVYRDESKQTPVLDVVKKAEQYLVDTQPTKSYLGSSGNPDFNSAIQAVTFGDALGGHERITTLQTPGGSGSLRVAAGLIMRATPEATVWVSDPTWANHIPLLGGAGLKLDSYPYYHRERNDIRFDDMLETLNGIPAGDIVLLHGCCHNPTGMDLARDQWQAVADVIVARELVPFIDIAYQGFAEGLDEDGYPVRLMFERVPEMIVSSSCCKNFGLYRDRVGSLSLVGRDGASNSILRSHANNIVRTMYSMPPDHGGSVVSYILGDERLRREWLDELARMRDRLKEMRALLAAALREKAPDHDFSHLQRGNGLFSFVGLSPEQVKRIKSEFGVYMVDTSRINVAGITPGNVAHLASAIAAVL